MPYGCIVIAEVVALSQYESQIASLMDEDERSVMEFYIATAPEAHPVIPGSGGFRKARWARRGQGKSRGFRVIYFYISPPGQIYLASIYAKADQANVSGEDQNALARIAATIKKQSKVKP